MPRKFKKTTPPPTAKANNTKGPRVLYWFRTDLRLHDSPGLTHALSLDPSVLIPLWTWDPHYVYRQRGAANRWNFLLDCMRDVSASLTALNPRQRLFVVRAAPQAVVRLLVEEWDIDVLVFEADTDAYAKARDEEVREALAGQKVHVVPVRAGRTLFDPDDVVVRNGGRPTMSMAQLTKASGKIESSTGNGGGGGQGQAAGEPRRPIERPERLPDPLGPEDMDLSGLEGRSGAAQGRKMEQHEAESNGRWPRAEGLLDYNAVHRTGKDEETQFSSGLMGPNRDFAVPTLEEMGIDPADVTTPHRGGETVGLELLAKHVVDEEYIATFEKPATAPTAFEPPATTLLSPHLHFGSLSCRKFWWDVQAVLEKRRKAKKPVSEQPVNIPGQLLFRDMYFAAHAQVGIPFGQIVGNPVARFIPWHLQSRYSTGADGRPVVDGTYIVDSPEAEEYFQRWKHGRTGFPWIDALMRQLKQEGWIHHLGRHAVACFLTRGGCYVSWERGAEVFEEWLLDHEVACNAGNWMWLSCTAFFSQFYRCYSPVAFPKKWDPEGLFVRRYVPELAGFDKKYIYEPHKAPIADQKSWGCVIKGDGSGKAGADGAHKMYPKPMFDFNERRQFCIDQMKKAYRVGLYGDDEKVVSGEWKELFDREDDGEAWKEEANGEVATGSKRSRGDADDESEDGDDMGEGADIGDESHNDRPGGRKAAKKEPGKKGQRQGTLDAMVTRGRAKKS